MKPCLYAEKIEFKVKSRIEPVLCQTTLSILPKEFVVILGANGSGKSTLVKILAGYINPTAGTVFIDQLQIDKIPPAQKASMLVTLTQKAEDRLFSELTLEENIILWESRFPANERLKSEQVIELTISPKKFTAFLKQPLNNFSGGEKQAILLALVIAHPPKVLFLDEHTSSLDPKASKEIMEVTDKVIKDNEITSVMITHNLEDAVNYGKRLIVLNAGKIIVDQEKPTNFLLKELKELIGYSSI